MVVVVWLPSCQMLDGTSDTLVVAEQSLERSSHDRCDQWVAVVVVAVLGVGGEHLL